MQLVSNDEIHQLPRQPSNDEMSELHNQFSDMLDRLESSQHELELDQVTGLSNRNVFLRQLQRKLTLAKQKGTLLFLTQLKLHNLSGINDTFGSTTGDQALQMMSQLLTALLCRLPSESSYDEKTLARIGSDEFAFVLEQTPMEPHGGALRICELLAKRLDDPIQLGGVSATATL